MATAIPPIPNLSGLSGPEQLDAWRKWRAAVLGGDATGSDPSAVQNATAGMTPQQAAFFNGPNPRPGDARFTQSGAYSDQFSPDAEQAFVNDTTHYNVGTGQTEKNKGLWDLPETGLQIAFGAALGGGAALSGLSGAADPGTVAGDITDASQLADAAPAAETTAETAAAAVPGAGLPGSPGFAPGDVTNGVSQTTSWLGKNATGLIGVGGQLANTAIQAVAAGKATAAQEKLAEEALTYEKSLDAYKATTEANRYGAMANAKSPFVQEGQEAGQRFSSLLGLTPAPLNLPAAPPTYAPAPIPGLTGSAAQPLPATDPNAAVLVRHPNGSTRQVPAGQVNQWTALGYAPV